MEPGASSLSLAALLKRYRCAAGLTQETLAERAGYSTTYLSKLEQGARMPLQKTSGKAPVIHPGDKPPLLCPEGTGDGAPS